MEAASSGRAPADGGRLREFSSRGSLLAAWRWVGALMAGSEPGELGGLGVDADASVMKGLLRPAVTMGAGRPSRHQTGAGSLPTNGRQDRCSLDVCATGFDSHLGGRRRSRQ